MNRALTAYGIWLASVLVLAGIAASWYRHVEEIGWRELFARLRPTPEDDAE